MSLDLDSIKAAQARVYAEVSVYEKGDAALGFLDSGVVDDLVTEVERLRHVLETHEAQYRRHRDDGYRLSAKHERERDEARAAIAVARQEMERLREQNDGLYQATLIVGAERDAARALAERAVNGWEEADDLFREQGSDDPERLPAPGIADVRAALRGDGS